MVGLVVDHLINKGYFLPDVFAYSVWEMEKLLTIHLYPAALVLIRYKALFERLRAFGICWVMTSFSCEAFSR